MRYELTVSGPFGQGDGAISINGHDVVIYKKSAVVRAAFGMVGTMIASGKPVISFQKEDIETCGKLSFISSLSARMMIRLKTGEEILLRANEGKLDEIIALLRDLNAPASDRLPDESVPASEEAKEQLEFYCTKCGLETNEWALACPNCGGKRTISRH